LPRAWRVKLDELFCREVVSAAGIEPATY
jgi:hypothetical protein